MTVHCGCCGAAVTSTDRIDFRLDRPEPLIGIPATDIRRPTPNVIMPWDDLFGVPVEAPVHEAGELPYYTSHPLLKREFWLTEVHDGAEQHTSHGHVVRPRTMLSVRWVHTDPADGAWAQHVLDGVRYVGS